MWLNALSDGMAINSQARNIYVGALTKPSISRSRITSPSGSLSSVLDFKKFNVCNHGCCKLSQTMLRTAGVSPSIGQNRVLGSAITGTLSFHGALFKPMLGVIKWYPNGCFPFTTSRSAGNEVKKSGRKKSNSRNRKHSGVNTSNKCQTEQRQIPEISKTTKASLKHSPANGHVDVAETIKPMKTQSRSESKIAKGKPSSPKNNKRPSSTLLKREINVQEPINGSTEPFTTSESAGIEVKKSGGTNLNSRKKKHSGANTSKKCQTEQRQIQESSKTTNSSSKDSPANGHMDVVETSKPMKTQSRSKSKMAKGKPSSSQNNKRPSSTLLKREINVQDPLISSTEPFTTSGSAGIEVKKSGGFDKKSQVAVIKAKTRGLPKVNKDEQATKTNIKANTTDKKHSINVVQKLQAAAGERSKSENIKVSANQGAHLQESRMIKLTKAKQKKLPDNVKLVPGKLSENKKANTSVHAEGKVLVVVESATKAKTIQKYLGDTFIVLASYGHVRDLAGRAGSVRPEEDFDMVWEVPSAAWQHIRAIEEASTRVSSVILASDPDREGEAIAWHVTEMLKMQGSWKENMLVKRVVFHEITESAIRNAMETPRDISMNLVNAYLARRALDYLIGFNISPILWRKLPGCQSAGRVQSAALSLICEREKEIEDFVSQEYWTIEAEACTSERPVPGTNSEVMAKVTHVDGEKLEKFTIKSEAEAMKVVEKVSSSNFKVLNLKKSTKRKSAPLPYITSTLQQDASNKLNFRASHTMKVAQKLYEGVKISDNEVVGLITYMRTDGLWISEDALKSIHLQVTECYGQAYAVEGARKFVKKVKNAQEAHEAIRPTDIRRLPSFLANMLEEDALKLYTLIWCQTMACQMSEAKINQTRYQSPLGMKMNRFCFDQVLQLSHFLDI
jgi:DNA topoisomerase IA